MLSTPKKSTRKTMMEEAYASPPSKKDTENAKKQIFSKEQYLNSSNMKKNPFVSNFENTTKSNFNGFHQSQMNKQDNLKISSAVKPNNGYFYAQSPFISKNVDTEKTTQQRLFTIQTNKNNQTIQEFEQHTTPQKKNQYKRSLFSSDSLEGGCDSENDYQTNNPQAENYKENNKTQKKKNQQNTHIFAASAIPAQKTNQYTNNINQSARKVNPFLGADIFASKNSTHSNPLHFDRENRQMNAIAHERDLKKTPQINKNTPQINKNTPIVNQNMPQINKNLLYIPSPTEKLRMSGQPKVDNFTIQSPQINSWSSQVNKPVSKFISKFSDNSNDSINDMNNSCSSFNMNTNSTGSSGNTQMYNNSNIHQSPSKNTFHRGANQKLLFEEDGDRFDQDYEILQVLGSGYFGTVYKCLNKLDKNIYAVKVTKEQIRGENSQKQILKEAQALASLSACDEVEYIVCYHSAWIEDRQLHLAMEFCDSNLERYNLPQSQTSQFYSAIKKIFSDVVKGLHYLHTQNLVHLDLKPENILYNKKQNKFKIADLGLALIASKDHETYNQVQEGDARYLAKEVLNYYDAIDLKKADIFSLGAMMYYLLTQDPLPANGDEWLTIRSGNLPKLDELTFCPKELKTMIKQMMNPDPELRLSTQEILDSSYMKSDLINQIKWQKILKNLLISQIQKIEKEQQKQTIKRRNSLILQKINHFN